MDDPGKTSVVEHDTDEVKMTLTALTKPFVPASLSPPVRGERR
jgi:hypothetical protein